MTCERFISAYCVNRLVGARTSTILTRMVDVPTARIAVPKGRDMQVRCMQYELKLRLTHASQHRNSPVTFFAVIVPYTLHALPSGW